jgi:anti-sigma factor ChrR (cupin superfamily)
MHSSAPFEGPSPALTSRVVRKHGLRQEHPVTSDFPNQPFFLKNIFNITEWQDELKWEPFGEKVEICWVHRCDEGGPSTAFIRFQPGGKVSLHQHSGFEHIIVLAGSQADQNGLLNTGGLMIHPPGTRHSIHSDEGCIVLAIYEKRVSFVEPDKE